MKTLSVILCTYNEANNISGALKTLLSSKLVNEIIIIDDNSKDGTVSLINKFSDPRVKLVVRKNTRGFASAFIYGVIISKSDYIMRFDVDMFADINFFLDIFKKKNKYEFLIFSRYCKTGRDIRGPYRKISSLLINKLCQLLLSSKVKDYTSCIFFFKKDILKDLSIQNTSYANFVITFVYQAILKNIDISEVGFIQKKETEKNSKSAPNILIFLKNGFFYVLTIFKCFFLRFNRK